MARIPDFNDFIRIGVYSQMEGSCVVRNNSVQFTFFLQQIKDMKTLAKKVSDDNIKEHGSYLRIYSRPLYEELVSLGFARFRHDNWNVPPLKSFGEDGTKEYLRAVIDSIGNVDIEGATPYIQLSSVNKSSINKLAFSFDGHIRGPYGTDASPRYFLRWKGKKALQLLDYLDWEFNNFRNDRGASLIKQIRWEDYSLR